MRYHILLWAAFAVLVGSALASCSKDDGGEVALSGECFISSFSLGNVKRNIYDADGKVTSVALYTAGGYAFSIDQIGKDDTCLITNREPLLYGSRLQSVLCNISARGTVVYRPLSDNPNDNLNDDNWRFYVSTDSMDVSRPVVFRVWSTDGTQSRIYKLTVNVYEQDPHALTVSAPHECGQLEGLDVRRAFMDGDHLCVVGLDGSGNAQCVYPFDEEPEAQPYAGYDALRTGVARVDALLDASAYDTADADSLPTLDVSAASLTGRYGRTRYVMAGRHSAEDQYAVVWMCSDTSPLLTYNPLNTTDHALPALPGLQVAAHDGRFIALGTALDKIYVSSDYGTTWSASDDWRTTGDMRSATGPMAVATADDCVYVVRGKQIWTMKSNALAADTGK